MEVYGSSTPIKAIASVGAPEATQIVIRPFDPGTLKDIEKAVQASGLGLNPQLAQRIRDCDLLIALGPRLTEIETQGYPLPAPPVGD